VFPSHVPLLIAPTPPELMRSQNTDRAITTRVFFLSAAKNTRELAARKRWRAGRRSLPWSKPSMRRSAGGRRGGWGRSPRRVARAVDLARAHESRVARRPLLKSQPLGRALSDAPATPAPCALSTRFGRRTRPSSTTSSSRTLLSGRR